MAAKAGRAASATSAAELIQFVRLVAVVGGCLALLAFGATQVFASVFPLLRLDMALMAIALMGLNAVAAVAPLYWFANQNPIRIYMTSMLVRMAVVGGVTLSLVLSRQFGMSEAFTFVFSAMLGFVAFTAIEVRHLIRHQSTLLNR